MNKINKSSVIAMIAKRKSGKTVLVKAILKHFAYIPIAIVISPTERKNKTYAEFIPDCFIYDAYDVSIINNLLERQDNELEKMQEGKHKNVHKSHVDAILIMDDCLADNKWSKDKQMREIFMNGRHSKIMFIMTMQYNLGIPSSMRGNVDFVMLLQDNSMKSRKRLHEQYASMFPTFPMFNSTMTLMTENYSCMVIDNTSTSNNLSDCIFWYKAEMDDLKNFKFGSKKYWDYAKKHYNPNYKKDSGGMPISNEIILKNKNNIKINKMN